MVISGGSVTCAISFSFAACDRRLTLPDSQRRPSSIIIGCGCARSFVRLLDFVAGYTISRNTYHIV